MENIQPQPVFLCKMYILKGHRIQWRSENECFSCWCSQPWFTDFVVAGFQKSIQFCRINVVITAIKLFPFLESRSNFLIQHFSVMHIMPQNLLIYLAQLLTHHLSRILLFPINTEYSDNLDQKAHGSHFNKSVCLVKTSISGCA